MKKLLSSIILIITAMLLCCGCSGDGTANNYYSESVSITPISKRIDVVSINHKANSKKDRTGTLKVKEVELKNNDSLYVTYTYTNNEGSTSAIWHTYADFNAFQNGIALDSTTVGEMTEYTDIMAGASVDFIKKYTLQNTTDTVIILNQSTFDSIVYEDMEVTLGTVMNEYYIENSPCSCIITGAGKTADSQLVIDYSFTKTTEGAVVPATELAIQAYQGTERLDMTNQTMTDDTHYLKNYEVQPNQTVNLSTTFRLNNTTEDVTVYLTKPSTAEIYDKEIYSVK